MGRRAKRALLVVGSICLVGLCAVCARADAVEDAIAKARALRERSQFAEAAELLGALYQERSDRRDLKAELVTSLLLHGKQLIETAELEPALKPLSLAVELAPTQPSPHFLLAVCYFRSDRPQRARVEAQAVLAAAPDHVGAHEILGRLAYNEGKLEEALRSLESALRCEQPAPGLVALVEKVRRDFAAEEAMGARASQHFELRFANGHVESATAELVMRLLEEAYNAVGVEFGHYPLSRVPVTLYGDRQFYGLTGSHGWVGALYDGKIRVPVKGPVDEGRLRQVLTHEYTHACIFSVYARAPAWLHEGLAQHLAKEPFDDRGLRELARAGKLSSMESLGASFTKVKDPQKAKVLYLQAYAFVRFLHNSGGGGALGSLLRELGRGQSAEAAFRHVFGADLAELDRRWHAVLRGS